MYIYIEHHYICVYFYIYNFIQANVYFYFLFFFKKKEKETWINHVAKGHIKLCQVTSNFKFVPLYIIFFLKLHLFFFSIFLLSLLTHVAIFILFFPCFFFLILSSHCAPSYLPFSSSSSTIIISYALNSPRFHQKFPSSFEIKVGSFNSSC